MRVVTVNKSWVIKKTTSSFVLLKLLRLLGLQKSVRQAEMKSACIIPAKVLDFLLKEHHLVYVGVSDSTSMYENEPVSVCIGGGHWQFKFNSINTGASVDVYIRCYIVSGAYFEWVIRSIAFR